MKNTNKTDYIIYKRVFNKDEAVSLAELLQQHNIDALCEEDTFSVDAILSNSELNKDYLVKIKADDIEDADNILSLSVSQNLDNIPDNYYLLEFSDEELKEIIINADEWGKFDYLLAQRLLKERGKELSSKVIETSRKDRLQQLSQTEEASNLLIFAGYFCALLGGIISIFIGHSLRYGTKTLPDGKQYYVYSAKSRNHGYKIYILGIASFLCWMLASGIIKGLL